jgi:periplasmic divalent cation tolerance protein
MTDYVLAITTCTEDEAESIAYSLVEGKLCACANIISGITSIYAWRGKIERSSECLVFMKTEKNLTDRLYSALLEIHSYEVPEFIVISIADGSKDYLSWISKNVE